jgi:glycerophosphoryl diester phosphodiesterase
MVRLLLGGAVLILATALPQVQQQTPGRPKQLIAHRGASGYAPEHTIAAYQLALDQHADFVEPDLAISKDGVLICLHDDTLERTTNVEEVFPDRYSRESTGRGGAKQWIANDFTVAEIKRLDAGSWRDPTFAAARGPTWEEMVQVVRGKAGVYPELKSPPLYTKRGLDMVRIFVASVKLLGLDRADSLRSTPVIIQSFDEASVRRVATELPTIPRVFLTSDDADVTDARLRELARFATGIAPEKQVIARHPDMVGRAHAAGLTVTSWTFSAIDHPGYGSVRDEMAQYLYTWGIDALFTNNPDQFPGR